MPLSRIRDTLAAFIQSEGHRVEVSVADGSEALAEVVFRARGQMFSVTVAEIDAAHFSISTAYEVPDWVRDRSGPSDALDDIAREYPGTRFSLAHDGTIFVATLDYAGDVEGFTEHFWQIIGRLRDAGNTAVERMVDRSESKAAADKFIRQFLRGQR